MYWPSRSLSKKQLPTKRLRLWTLQEASEAEAETSEAVQDSEQAPDGVETAEETPKEDTLPEETIE